MKGPPMQKMLCSTVLVLTVLGQAIHADDKKVGFQDREYKEAKYVLFVPDDYTGDKEVPLILFLHGRGESGSDGKKQATVGLGNAIKKNEKTFPFIAIFPQSQKASWKADSEDGLRAIAILEEIQKEYKVDPKRIVLTGLSMGGAGTWSHAAKYPDRWSAMVPICGSGDTLTAATIKDIPCWCFWGDQDASVSASMPKMIKAVEEAGGKPKFTEYPGVGHNSWDKAYGTPELFTWMLEQKRK